MTDKNAIALVPVGNTENRGEVSPFGRTPKRVRVKLQSCGDVAQFLAGLIRMTRSGLMPVDHLAKYASACQVMKSLLEQADQDEKIEQLERAIAARNGRAM